MATTTPLAQAQHLYSAPSASRECRLCFEAGGEDLIAPCSCSGTSRWVHRRCLDKWRVSGTNPQAFTHCCECGSAYCLLLVRRMEDESAARSRRRRVVGQIIGNFFLAVVGLNVWLCLLAMLIRAIDTKEELVSIFNFPQLVEAPPIGQATFREAMYYRKSTYYLSAVIVSLIMLGFVATLSAMWFVCCRGAPLLSAPPTPVASSSDCDAFCCYCMSEELGDCCMACCRGCSEADCRGSSCAGDSSSCKCDDCNSDNAPACAAIGIAVLVFLFLVGFVVALVAAVTATAKVISKLLQTKELRMLTQEYIVQDLSQYQLGCVQQPQYPQLQRPPVQQMQYQQSVELGMGGVAAPQVYTPFPEPSAPPMQWAPVTDGTTQRQLTQDLQAIYGIRS